MGLRVEELKNKINHLNNYIIANAFVFWMGYKPKVIT